MGSEEIIVVDVVIVGAGPAGTAAAVTSAAAGLSTIVITKPLPECSEKVRAVQSIHPGVLSLLAHLDMMELVEVSSQGRFTGIQVNGHWNRLSTEEEEWEGHHIDRYLFDQGLQAALDRKGITIIETVLKAPQMSNETDGVVFRLSDGQCIKANYMVDATGYQRINKKIIQLEEKIYSTSLYCWSGVHRTRDVFPHTEVLTQFTKEEDGWLWLAPHGTDATTWTKLSTQKSVSSPFHYLTPLAKARAYNVRWRASRPICKDHVLLCGDSAGMLDPAAGQGILNAFMSGIMAARCVFDCLHHPDQKALLLMYYDQWFIQEFENKVTQLMSYYENTDLRGSS